MFERFTERARRCIYFARQSAAKYRSQTIETEHLLLGIVHEDPDVIWRFLPSRTAKDIRAEVESRLTKSTSEPPRLLGLLRLRSLSASIDIPLSLYCKRILAYGAEEAERLHHRHIDVDHLFMGVVREEDGTAGQILRSAGLHVINMREQMLLDETATE